LSLNEVTFFLEDGPSTVGNLSADPSRVEDEVDIEGWSGLCIGYCGFFGSEETGRYCNKCYSERESFEGGVRSREVGVYLETF